LSRLIHTFYRGKSSQIFGLLSTSIILKNVSPLSWTDVMILKYFRQKIVEKGAILTQNTAM
jgi:hypothetical protein